jgi:hypothetical protein
LLSVGWTMPKTAGPYIWVTCGRRHGKSFFDVVAALVGCGHVSGLLMRHGWPLALMLSPCEPFVGDGDSPRGKVWIKILPGC